MDDQSTSPDRTPGLTITRKLDGRGTVLALAGELDLASSPVLASELSDLGTDVSGRLMIDLERVEFMDSTGLAMIVRAHQSAQSNGHGFSLRRGPRQVQRLFELTGMLESFSFED